MIYLRFPKNFLCVEMVHVSVFFFYKASLPRPGRTTVSAVQFKCKSSIVLQECDARYARYALRDAAYFCGVTSDESFDTAKAKRKFAPSRYMFSHGACFAPRDDRHRRRPPTPQEYGSSSTQLVFRPPKALCAFGFPCRTEAEVRVADINVSPWSVFYAARRSTSSAAPHTTGIRLVVDGAVFRSLKTLCALP